MSTHFASFAIQKLFSYSRSHQHKLIWDRQEGSSLPLSRRAGLGDREQMNKREDSEDVSLTAVSWALRRDEGILSNHSMDTNTYLGTDTSLVLSSILLIQPGNKQSLSITSLSAVCCCRPNWVGNYTRPNIWAVFCHHKCNVKLWAFVLLPMPSSREARPPPRCWLQHSAALGTTYTLCFPHGKQATRECCQHHRYSKQEHIPSHRSTHPSYWLIFIFTSFSPEHKYDWKDTWNKQSLNKQTKKEMGAQITLELMWRQPLGMQVRPVLWLGQHISCFFSCSRELTALPWKTRLQDRIITQKPDSFCLGNCSTALSLCISREVHFGSFITLWLTFLHGLGSSATLKIHELQPLLPQLCL